MTRRAVQDFLRDNPDSLPTSAQAPPEQISDNASDAHPYNRPCQIAYVGSLAVFTFLDDPGSYYLDLWGRVRATEAQARAAFGPEALEQHRRDGEDLAQQRRIDQAVEEAVAARDGQKSPEELQAEKLAELRRKAAKAVRGMEQKAQRQSDKDLTRWLDQDAPARSA
jgi:hypothetical protein